MTKSGSYLRISKPKTHPKLYYKQLRLSILSEVIQNKVYFFDFNQYNAIRFYLVFYVSFLETFQSNTVFNCVQPG